ncbi:MAG: aromatic ring-hydroxylating dioxygenase subunit alpha [Rhodospirillales bacterium]|nr:aromatic ring-hydroxylating dioxygenase subunit alpha [Rhodospirillales bacterium]MBT4040533.1 aromatic ring-hydroxylating dioxygenase subunit alpha [Rhodospirillales bacterium]MBT4625558.1 aromatic ring-hydroxylating dioxygenase subunit alpha [Rhodospirillales bacterium]MBT5352263.1 aromatic ring-hydroxylating dioxygenase subunit alpha [Rhodospirillales bacterium]MBT5521359.1 aromatic ring-hydroxylating dioxygenase subunit alpha [Rhodospirillales bacterium]
MSASEMDDLFDPAHYAETLADFGSARTLPAWCYTDASFFQREMERCFHSNWHFIGHESEIAEPGQYIAVDLVIGPVIVIRGKDGEIRSFANTCRHRGARLLENGQGHCATIVCPYHAWTYEHSGNLRGAPAMEEMPEFCKEDWGLIPFRVEQYGGFMWVTSNGELPALTDYLGDFTSRFEGHDFGAMRVVRRETYDIACNWKVLAENALEEYHTGVVHSNSLGQQHSVPVETLGRWCALFIASETSLSILPGETSVLPHIATLNSPTDDGTYFTMLYPNTQFACSQDSMWCVTFHPVSPEQTQVRVAFCFPSGTVALDSFEAESQKYFHRWITGIEEDNAIGPVQQQGLRSPASVPGPYGPKEFTVHEMNKWTVRCVTDQ